MRETPDPSAEALAEKDKTREKSLGISKGGTKGRWWMIFLDISKNYMKGSCKFGMNVDRNHFIDYKQYRSKGWEPRKIGLGG